MGRTLSELLDQDFQFTLTSVKVAFEQLGNTLRDSINPNIASTIAYQGCVFDTIKQTMINRLETDLQNGRGPVAKRLMEQDRLEASKVAYITRISNGSTIYTNKRQSVNIELLTPTRFKHGKNFLYELLKPYFAFHYYDSEANISYLSSFVGIASTYKNKITLKVQDCDLQPIKYNDGRPPIFKLTFTDTQPSGCVVQIELTVNYWTTANINVVKTDVTVVHDELEDATYRGLQEMANLELLKTRLRYLMEAAGWSEEKHLEEQSYSVKTLEQDIANLFKVIPLPKEIDFTRKQDWGFYQTYWTEDPLDEESGKKLQHWSLDLCFFMNGGVWLTVSGVDDNITSIKSANHNGKPVIASRDMKYPDELRFKGTDSSGTLENFILDHRARYAIIEELRAKHTELVERLDQHQEENND